jgi:hypothetical protein
MPLPGMGPLSGGWSVGDGQCRAERPQSTPTPADARSLLEVAAGIGIPDREPLENVHRMPSGQLPFHGPGAPSRHPPTRAGTRAPAAATGSAAEAVLERAADGTLIVMPPTGGETGSTNGELLYQLLLR